MIEKNFMFRKKTETKSLGSYLIFWYFGGHHFDLYTRKIHKKGNKEYIVFKNRKVFIDNFKYIEEY